MKSANLILIGAFLFAAEASALASELRLSCAVGNIKHARDFIVQEDGRMFENGHSINVRQLHVTDHFVQFDETMANEFTIRTTLIDLVSGAYTWSYKNVDSELQVDSNRIQAQGRRAGKCSIMHFPS